MRFARNLDTGHIEEDYAPRPRTLGRFARRAWIPALALGVSAGLSLIGTGSVSFTNTGSESTLKQGDVIKTDFLRNIATGRCLTARENIFTYVTAENCGSPGNLEQTWSLVYSRNTGQDNVQIKNTSSGKCLTYNPSNDLLTLIECDWGMTVGSLPIQEWAGIGTGWDRVELRSEIVGGMLDSTAAGEVGLNPRNGGDNQKWKSGF